MITVSFACYHPELPIIISGSEDGTVKIWNANTARLEQTLNYGLERAWCVSYQRGKQNIAIGFDEGMVVLKMGREEPAMSMDASGKIIYAKHTDIVTTQIKGIEADQKDGERLTLPTKDLGSTEVYPQSLQHSPNGRFVAVCGDGEWIIYTSLALRNQAFGSGLDFAWGSKENDKDYAVRESATSVKLYRNFKERPGGGLDVGFQAEGLSGGTLLGVKGQGGVGFFDWNSGKLVRRIEVEPRSVYWSESGELVALACEDTFYVLRFSRESYETALGNGEVDEDGVEAAFEVVTDQPETVTSGCWVGDCFVYTTSTHRLNYLVGEKSYTVSHFDQPMYTLGYLARDGRIYLCDKDVTIVSFALSLALVEFQTLVLRDDLETAMEMLPDIGVEQKGKIARFLEGQGYKEEALEVATDPEHRFDLALALGKLDQALELARERDEEHKWRVVGDAALVAFDLALAEECFWHARDLGSLLLLYSASNDQTGLRKLADRAREVASHNILFDCYWLLGDVSSAVDLLRDEAGALTGPLGRKPEAALFALTYAPSKAPGCVTAWKGALEEQGRGRVARGLGVPPGTEGAEADTELFDQWDAWLEREKAGGEYADDEVAENGAGEEDEEDGVEEAQIDGAEEEVEEEEAEEEVEDE
jgi:coatomer subunit beta'